MITLKDLKESLDRPFLMSFFWGDIICLAVFAAIILVLRW